MPAGQLAIIGTRVPLEHKPSDYFRERVWISCDPDERTIPALVERFGDRFMWASDFPHNDAQYPGVVDELREHNGDLPDDARAGLFGLNALDLYGIARPADR